MQGQFKITIPISAIHHINRLEKENIITAIDAKQHLTNPASISPFPKTKFWNLEIKLNCF